MSENIFNNPLSDIINSNKNLSNISHDNNTNSTINNDNNGSSNNDNNGSSNNDDDTLNRNRASISTAKELLHPTPSNDSALSSISNKSSNSNTSNHISTFISNNIGNSNNVASNKDDNNEIYSKIKVPTVNNDQGSTEYVYSMVDKDKKGRNNDGGSEVGAYNNNHINNKTASDNKEATDDKNEDNCSDISQNERDDVERNNINKYKISDVYEHIGVPQLDKEDKDEEIQRKEEDFYAVFLGSMLVDLKKLKDNKVSYVAECIKSVAGLTAQTTTLSKTKEAFKKITLSENRGMSVMMRLEGNVLRVMQRGTQKTRLLIRLDQIRMWGVGKEKNSRELAIISKDEEIQNVLCRVLLCENEASLIAKRFFEVCQKLASTRKNDVAPKSSENGTTSSNECKKSNRLSFIKSNKKIGSKESIDSIETDSKNTEKSKKKSGDREDLIKRKSRTQQTLPLIQGKAIVEQGSIRTTLSDGHKDSLYNHSDNEISCFYLGMMEVKKSTGLKTLEHAIDMVKKYVAEDNWMDGSLRCSQSGVCFVHHSKTKITCDSVNITFAGISFKYKNFLGVMVTGTKNTFVHVFSIKGDSIGWFESMKFVCHLHSSKWPKPESTLKKWK